MKSLLWGLMLTGLLATGIRASTGCCSTSTQHGICAITDAGNSLKCDFLLSEQRSCSDGSTNVTYGQCKNIGTTDTCKAKDAQVRDNCTVTTVTWMAPARCGDTGQCAPISSSSSSSSSSLSSASSSSQSNIP